MEFMGIAVGILALICALVLLFGQRGARRVLGWGAVAVIATVALFYAGVAFYAWTAKPFEDLIPPTPIAVGILALICTLVLLFRGARRVLGWGVVAVALFYAGVAAQRHYGAWTATAPKLLSDAEVGLAPNNRAVTAPPFDPSKPYKVTLKIGGRLVDVDDGFLRLSPQQQQASVNEIARSLGIGGSITWSYASYDDVAPAPSKDMSGQQQAPTSQRGLTDEEVGLCGTATTPVCQHGFAQAPVHHPWEYDPIIKCADNRTAPVQLNSGIWVCR